MKFWLGVHKENWLAQTDVGLFVSHRTLRKRRTLPVSAGAWCLDSGGFTQLSITGSWDMSVSDYAEAIERYATEIGMLEWAAPMDWMCEPAVVEATGLSVREHQERTVENYLALRGGPVVPVLQGWEPGDYFACADLYASAGVDLRAEPVVGIGSVCRRQDTRGAEDVIVSLAQDGIALHGFGFKLTGLRRVGYLLASADSMAWSYEARRKQAKCGGRFCHNHLHAALAWRERVLRSLDYQQTHLSLLEAN